MWVECAWEQISLNLKTRINANAVEVKIKIYNKYIFKDSSIGEEIIIN